MGNEVKFDIKAEASNAKRELKATAKEADKLTGAVDDAGAALADSGAAAAAQFKKASLEIGKAHAEYKKLAREQAKASRGGGGGFGGLLAGWAGKAWAAASAAPAAVLGAAVHEGLGAEAVERELVAANAGGAGKIMAANEAVAARFGMDSQVLNKQAARLSQAGYNTEQVVKVIQANVVAARGDVARLEGLMDELVEAGTRGYLEESVLGKFDEAGVGLRTELMKRLDMGKEQLESALSAGAVSTDVFFDVIERVAGEGTRAMEMAEAQANSTAGALARMRETGSQMLEELGKEVLDFVDGPLAAIADGMAKVKKAALPEVQGEYLVYEKTAEELERERRDAMAAEAAKAEEKRREGLAEVLRGQADAYRRLAEAAGAARRAEAAAAETLAERRERVAATVGLGADAGVADVDALLHDDAGLRGARQAAAALDIAEQVKALIAEAPRYGLTGAATRADVERAQREQGGAMDGWFGRWNGLQGRLGVRAGGLSELDAAAQGRLAEQEGGDLARATALMGVRRELAEIAKLEKAAAEAAAKAAEAAKKEAAARKKTLEGLRRRRELAEAEMAGDKERAQVLRDEEAALKIYDEYRAARVREEEAALLAAQEVGMSAALRDADERADAGDKSAGWLRSSLQDVGGAAGGNRRLYDAASMQPQKATAANTQKMHEVTEKIFEYLKDKAFPAFAG